MTNTKLKITYVDQTGFGDEIVLFDDLMRVSPSIRSDTVTKNGITIDFYYHDDTSKHPNPFEKTLGFSGSRIALESKGEQFGIVSGKRWSDQTGFFGLGGIGRNVSVIIKPDPLTCSHSDDRVNLMINGVPKTPNDYAGYVASSVPKWLDALVNTNQKSRTKNILNECQKLLEQLVIVNTVPVIGQNVQNAAIQTTGGVKGPSRAPATKTGSHPGKATATKQSGNGSQILTAPATITLNTNHNPGKMLAPGHAWVSDPTKGYTQLIDKGCYFTEGSLFYYINLNYPVIDTITSQFFAMKGVPDCVKGNQEAWDIVFREVQDYCAMVLGKYIVRCMAKSINSPFTKKEVYAEALSICALTTVFDTCVEYGAEKVFNRVKNMTAWCNLVSKLGGRAKTTFVQYPSGNLDIVQPELFDDPDLDIASGM